VSEGGEWNLSFQGGTNRVSSERDIRDPGEEDNVVSILGGGMGSDSPHRRLANLI